MDGTIGKVRTREQYIELVATHIERKHGFITKQGAEAFATLAVDCLLTCGFLPVKKEEEVDRITA